jgi:toxin ParE1/3/4
VAKYFSTVLVEEGPVTKTTVFGRTPDHDYDGLLGRFERNCEAPLMYPAGDHIREGYRRSVYEKHWIYFVVEGSVVEVQAVVKRQNISNRL